MRDAAIGFGLGFFVALQLGPMSLFLIRSTLRGGLRIGLAIGAGIAMIDAVYAAAGAAGAAPFLAIGPLRLAFGIAGALVLLWLGVRTVLTAFRVRAGLEVAGDVQPRGGRSAPRWRAPRRTRPPSAPGRRSSRRPRPARGRARCRWWWASASAPRPG